DSHNYAKFHHVENEKHIVETVRFRPNFTQNLYFVYLNKKQNSRTAIANYKSKKLHISETVQHINHITREILQSKTLTGFCHLLEKQEANMIVMLEIHTANQQSFQDF